MGDFRSSEELEIFLVTASARYGKYAEPLWKNEIRSRTELANVSVTSLVAGGVSNVAHAEAIQVHVKAAGMH